MRAYYFLFTTALLCWGCSATDNPSVTVREGVLLGFSEGGVTKFLGIPYAEPPVNQLRFAKPLPKKPWSPATLNCTRYGFVCPQIRSTALPMAEDCLTLNVFVPGEIRNTSTRAVLVWVHGGGYRHGTSSDYKPSALALHGDVIIVTINYRLNSFGFLTTGDDHSKGNYGLWDQHLAFKWIKDNMAVFGGDVSRITIAGASAGGFSVALQAIAPVNSGLFQRVVSQSGSALSPRATKSIDHALNMTYWFGRVVGGEGAVNQSVKDHAQLMACLRSKNQSELLDAYSKINRRLYGSFVPHWTPVVDGDFIPASPAQSLSDTSSDAYRTFAKLDFMAGSNSADGAIYYASNTRARALGFRPFKDGMTSDVFVNNIIPAWVEAISTNVYKDTTNVDQLPAVFATFYDSDKINMTSRGQRAIDFQSDAAFIACTARQTRVHSLANQGSSYIYYFDHEPRYRKYAPSNGYPDWMKGASHVEERMFLFGLENYYPSNVNIEDDERQLMNDMMTYWTNFVKTGDPNSPSAVNVTWPKYMPSSRGFMDLGVPRSAGINLLKARDDFWSYTVPEVMAKKPDRTSSTEPTSTASVCCRQRAWLVSTIVLVLVKWSVY